MCTAITYKTKDHYFGRNLDLEYSYNEAVTITPRNYIFEFRKMGEMGQKPMETPGVGYKITKKCEKKLLTFPKKCV